MTLWTPPSHVVPDADASSDAHNEEVIDNLLWLKERTETQTWVPQLYQNGNRTSTIDYAEYVDEGEWVTVACHLSNLGAGAAGNNVEVRNLPVSAAAYSSLPSADLISVGTYFYNDGGVPKVGSACFFSGVAANALVFIVPGGFGLGVNPSMATASVDDLGFTVRYRKA